MEIPNLFPPGEFKGKGEWRDRKGDSGNYTSEFKIVDETDTTKVQITRRHFFNNDGSFLYEENSQVIFKFSVSPFTEVSIQYGEATTTGQGYWFNNLCHYDLDVAADNHIENTYVFSDGKIELLGSATNKGNLTVWTETLHSVA
jgi:hypothetical protein